MRRLKGLSGAQDRSSAHGIDDDHAVPHLEQPLQRRLVDLERAFGVEPGRVERSAPKRGATPYQAAICFVLATMRRGRRGRPPRRGRER